MITMGGTMNLRQIFLGAPRMAIAMLEFANELDADVVAAARRH
jgi:hypothetical protein